MAEPTLLDNFTNATSENLEASHVADLGSSATPTWGVGVGNLKVLTTGRVRQGGSSAAVYFWKGANGLAPNLHRVIGTVTAGTTLLAGTQAQILGRLVGAPAAGSTDRYQVHVVGVDTDGTVNIVLGRASATGVVTALATFTVPTAWTAGLTKTLALGLTANGRQVAFYEGVPVGLAFDTTIANTRTRVGIGYGSTAQADATQGYQLDSFKVDELTTAIANTTAPSISGSATVGGTLTGDPGAWAAGDTNTIQWMRETAAGSNAYVAINGETAATYHPVSGDAGLRLTYAVVRSTGAVPKDLIGTGFALATSSAITAGAPVNTAAPAVTGTPNVGSTLSTSNGSWSGTLPMTSGYQWQSSADGATGWTNEVGATSSTYPVVAGDAGRFIRAQVTMTNADGGPVTASSNVVQVPAAPVNTTPPAITPAGPYSTNEVVHCDGGSWSGAPALSFQWWNGGSPITGATSADYTLQQTDEGRNIFCRVKAVNGGVDPAAGVTADSNTIVPNVTAPLSDDSGQWYYSGGAGNADPAASIGGARGGTIPASGVSDVFGPIPGAMARDGGTLYAVLIVRNLHTISTDPASVVLVEQQPTVPGGGAPYPGLTIAVAVPSEGVNTPTAMLASRTSPPAESVTWSTTNDPAAAPAFGDLGPQDWRALYVRLTIAPDTARVDDAEFIIDVYSATA